MSAFKNSLLFVCSFARQITDYEISREIVELCVTEKVFTCVCERKQSNQSSLSFAIKNFDISDVLR